VSTLSTINDPGWSCNNGKNNEKNEYVEKNDNYLYIQYVVYGDTGHVDN
jgi:hypothetical protein